MKINIRPSKITLVETCYACPEQYDAFFNGKQVGYLRLRHGQFTVDYQVCGGDTIYDASPHGDGRFDDDERDYYLDIAKEAICQRYNKYKKIKGKKKIRSEK